MQTTIPLEITKTSEDCDLAMVAVTENFTWDPNLLASMIRSQAGTLLKALLEAVMNSIDAGATRVNITLDKQSFIIEDNGRGFASEKEIVEWFGRFGTPHKDGDVPYGRFRMGRGQIFSYAATVWTSNKFQLSVDLNNRGFTYDRQIASQPYRGCRIEGRLYRVLDEYDLKETLIEFRRYVAFTPVPVYVNGTLFGSSPSRLKNWTSQTDDAWVRLSSEAKDLAVYNQGVYVCSMPTWKIGMGGVVVSKPALKVNFARNDIMEWECEVWMRIRKSLEKTVFNKLASAQKLSDGERTFLARRIRKSSEIEFSEFESAKVLTEPGGRHVPLSALKDAHTIVYVPNASTGACQVHGSGVFVITDQVVERFGCQSFDEFISCMRDLPGVIDPLTIIQEASDAMKERGVGASSAIDEGALKKRQAAAFKALQILNEEVGSKLQSAGMTESVRSLLLARQKKETATAWTDGKTFITANVKYLKEFEKGLIGAQHWVYTLIHEYMHDTDDSESHAHGEVFYAKFHDSVFDQRINTAKLAQDALINYLAALKSVGVTRPRKLSKELQIHIPR